MDAAGHQIAVLAQPEAIDCELLALAPQLDVAGEQLTRGLLGRFLDAGDDGDGDWEDPRHIAVEVQIDGIFARHDAARIGHLVVHAGGIGPLAEIVAQQIEDHAALVGVADRHVAGRLHPQVDIVIDAVRPARLDHHVAGRVGVLGGFRDRRVDVRHDQNHAYNEAAQRQRDQVTKYDAGVVVLEAVKTEHGLLHVR